MKRLHWSWEFLTKVVGLDPRADCIRLFTENDDEAFDIWQNEIGIAPETDFPLR